MPITKEGLDQLGRRPPTLEESLAQQAAIDAERLRPEIEARAAAEAQRHADLAEAEAEAERARAAEVVDGEAVREAGAQAVTQLLVTEGNELSLAVDEAKAALDAAMSDKSADVPFLFECWLAYRTANARRVALVGEGRRLVSIGRGTTIPQATDALDSVSFGSILDQAVTLRIADERQHYQAKVYEVSEAATAAAIAKAAKPAAKVAKKS